MVERLFNDEETEKEIDIFTGPGDIGGELWGERRGSRVVAFSEVQIGPFRPNK